MFRLARLCGEYSLKQEANEALQFTEEMIATHHKPKEIQRFRMLKMFWGGKWSVAISEKLRDWFRRSPPTQEIKHDGSQKFQL